ncbi:MAG: hypothetical protein OJJ21_16945 [Ferrovibrio sp.]|uniref:hypothetical protein n=1 Tax=Ferrovibrio sp. TaxID=1917215 RepID=UPI0026148399|nr:hypothetical protein [Ferrovibrio sp.]MCW0235289.1 hypothetical protein [Ferrovibrio sp.]
MAAVYNFAVDRGASQPPIVFRLPYDFTGSIFEMKVQPSGGEALLLSTENGSLAMVVEAGVSVIRDGIQTSGSFTALTWAYTPEQSRLITKAEYELQQTDAFGEQVVWMRGSISGIGGLNND